MEKLSMLVNMGTLPSEAQPPTNLHSDPTSTYNSWLSGLDPNTKSLVLSEVSECNREEWILQVSTESCDLAQNTLGPQNTMSLLCHGENPTSPMVLGSPVNITWATAMNSGGGSTFLCQICLEVCFSFPFFSFF